MSDEHKRKCWDCGNVAVHARSITPEVLCTKCGSQDTRRIKEPEPTILFHEVNIAVIGFANGKARQILLTKEQRELVKAFIESFYSKGESISMSAIELPLMCEATP